MTERELIKKLNNLRNVSPDASWKKSNREILYAQISNSAHSFDPTPWQSFWMHTRNVVSVTFQPAVALVAFVMVVFSSFLASNIFFRFKPGDSLYIARVLSEKARLNVTFDGEEKNRLEIQYAKDHARDIANLLSDPQFTAAEGNQKEVAKLDNDLKQEISRLKTLAPAPVASATEDDKVFSAESGKDDSYQLYSANPSAQPVNLATPTYGEKPATDTPAITASTSTPAVGQSLEDLVNSKNYKEVINKLETIK